MTAEEELAKLRKQIEADAKKALRRNRQVAYMFGITAMVALTALVFAFFEQGQAVRGQLRAESAQWIAEKEVSTLRKQIQIEMKKSQACEKAMIEHQAADLAGKNLKNNPGIFMTAEEELAKLRQQNEAAAKRMKS